jgi:hypothetical protein
MIKPPEVLDDGYEIYWHALPMVQALLDDLASRCTRFARRC